MPSTSSLTCTHAASLAAGQCLVVRNSEVRLRVKQNIKASTSLGVPSALNFQALSPRAACTTPPRILRDYTCTLIRHQFLSPYHPIGRAVSGNSFTDLSSDDHVASAGLSRATKSNAAAPPDFAVVVTRAGRPPTSKRSPPSTSLRTLSVLCDI